MLPLEKKSHAHDQKKITISFKITISRGAIRQSGT
jgi:hypothetical protein